MNTYTTPSPSDSPSRVQRRSEAHSWARRLSQRFLRLLVLIPLAIMLGLIASTCFFISGLSADGVALTRPVPGERVNLLLLGQDAGITSTGTMTGRNDVILLLSLDPVARSALLLSIPRDTRVDHPGVGSGKINAARVYGGTTASIAAVEELLGESIHFFVETDFTGLAALVDAAGGVWIDIQQEMHYSDPYDVPPLEIHFLPGEQLLDGTEAVHYLRYRDLLGDIGRLPRQRNFLLTLTKQLINPLAWWRLPEVAKQAKLYTHSNLEVTDLLSLGWQYLRLTAAPVPQTLPGQGSFDGAYWLPDYTAIPSLFLSSSLPEQELSFFRFPAFTWDVVGWWRNTPLAKLFTPAQELEKGEIFLTVLNGNGGQGSATRAAENLKSEGYNIVRIGDANNYNYANSVIIYNSNAEAKAKLLQGSIPGASLQAATEDNQACDLVVVIGVSYHR